MCAAKKKQSDEKQKFYSHRERDLAPLPLRCRWSNYKAADFVPLIFSSPPVAAFPVNITTVGKLCCQCACVKLRFLAACFGVHHACWADMLPICVAIRR